jgi:GNAT superfamily N-acetyltransferase
MPISIDQWKQIPLLDPFIERFQNINFEWKPLNDYKYCILWQTCIDKEYRGKGVLEKLYKELQNRLSHKYDLWISEIWANNSRSLYTHVEKIWLQIIETYIADGKERHVVVLDFRKFR